MIAIEHLTHCYPARRKAPSRLAIDDLSLAVGEAEFCILSGPNGSGKSTLFRILCGMLRPSSGRVWLGGVDVVEHPKAARDALGVVFQSPAVDKYLTVAENLTIQADLYGLAGRDYYERRDEALAWTRLHDRLHDKVETLSGGLARQVELAKALLIRPRALLLDEPTTGLDPASRRAFIDTVREIQLGRRITVLMTSHVFAEAEAADRVAIMKDGRLVTCDTPVALRARLGREMVVLQSAEAPMLDARIRQELGLKTRRHGDEIRFGETENGESLPLLENLLARYRGDIGSIAIKQPSLEDVFIHLTAAAPNGVGHSAPLSEGALR